MRLETLQDVLITDLRYIYNAELQLSTTLPQVLHEAYSTDLKKIIDLFHQANQQNQQSLLNIFSLLHIESDLQDCEGMRGLLLELDTIIDSEGVPFLKDAALLESIDQILHYLSSRYGAARTYSRELGYVEIAELLQNDLDKTSEIDSQCTSIAKGGFFA
jgi:ferritin-like metal-binding protein YciE